MDAGRAPRAPGRAARARPWVRPRCGPGRGRASRARLERGHGRVGLVLGELPLAKRPLALEIEILDVVLSAVAGFARLVELLEDALANCAYLLRQRGRILVQLVIGPTGSGRC